jgi:hypothetical protein
MVLLVKQQYLWKIPKYDELTRGSLFPLSSLSHLKSTGRETEISIPSSADDMEIDNEAPACITPAEGQDVQAQHQPRQFTMREDEAERIGQSLRQSVHAPPGVQLEPPRRSAPSRASTSSSIVTRSKGFLGRVTQANSGITPKRRRTEYVMLDEGDSEPSEVRTVSEYQPSSALTQKDTNTPIPARETARAPGKENTIFSHATPALSRTPAPRGRNKRTIDSQMCFDTVTTPEISFTKRTSMQEERTTRRSAKKQSHAIPNA